MSSLTRLDLVKIFRMIKYPVEELEAPLPHNKKVCRLYKKALKLSLPAPWASHLFLPYVSRLHSLIHRFLGVQTKLDYKHTQNLRHSPYWLFDRL